jgi:hypothetical protein
VSFLREGEIGEMEAARRGAAYIEASQKFSFYGAIEERNFSYLTDFGRDMLSSGAANFPHEKTYFEFGCRAGETDMVCAMWGGTDDPTVFAYVSRDFGRSWCPAGAIHLTAGETVSVYLDLVAEEKEIVPFTYGLRDIFYACIALLASTSVTVAEEVVSEAINRKRLAVGKSPLYSHTVVTINHNRLNRAGGGDGTHASPRLHWRRGHVRHYRSGAVSWIAPTLVGCADRGIVTHDYRVKARSASAPPHTRKRA